MVTLLLGALGQGGCTQNSNSFSQIDSDDESMSGNGVPYYYLKLNVQDARVQTTVNGVGFHEGDGRTGLSFNSPMNDILIGKDNCVTVTVKPTMVPAGERPKSGDLADADSVRPSSVEDAEVSVRIKKITSGKVTPEGGEMLAKKTLEEAVEKRREVLQKKFQERIKEASPSERKGLAEQEDELTSVELPVEIELTFDSEDVPSFRERFVEAPVIEDTSALKDFAMTLRKRAELRDYDGLYEAFKYKFEEYDQAYPGEAEEDNREWFSDLLDEHYYSVGPLLDFEREDLKLKKWADGRIWEINVDRGGNVGDKFFLGKVGERGRWGMDIFVGKVSGELKVVR